MKIVYCIAGTYNSGGMERIVIDKANWLANNGYQVVIVTTEQNNRSSFFQLHPSIKCIDLGINYSASKSLLAKIIIRPIKLRIHKVRLKRTLKAEGSDITISTYGNEAEFLHSIKHGGKKILEIHFSRWFRIQRNEKGLHGLLNTMLARRDLQIVKKYDKFVCLTEQDAKSWGGIQNMCTIPNFINEEKGFSRVENKRIIAVGRLEYQKGYDRMIKVWNIVHKEHSDWKLDIFGSGPLEDEIRRKIWEYKLQDSIRILKPISGIKKEMINSSCLLLTSYYEGLPMVLIEGLSCGLPLVAFDCKCGPREVIEDGINGFLIPDGNIEEMAGALSKLIIDNKLRKQMALNSKMRVKKFLVHNIMPKWVKLFNEIMSEP